MAEIVNLRKARKAAERSKQEKSAEQNRITHGRSKSERELETARAEQSRRRLDVHRIEQGDVE